MNSTDIFVQIKEIQRQLWVGHASLMVGCGFSRNANKATPIENGKKNFIVRS